MTSADQPVLIPVRVTPRASRDGIDGVADGSLRIRVMASPVDGGANTAVDRIIAEALGLPRSSVRVARGATGRRKMVAVKGLAREALVDRWPDLGV
ncbi:MAG: DUF167 domain-containing protein [Chloroflexi bacterium]|nr:DUF167 domain-containing protein [Chloroflexota bacterium]